MTAHCLRSCCCRSNIPTWWSFWMPLRALHQWPSSQNCWKVRSAWLIFEAWNTKDWWFRRGMYQLINQPSYKILSVSSQTPHDWNTCQLHPGETLQSFVLDQDKLHEQDGNFAMIQVQHLYCFHLGGLHIRFPSAVRGRAFRVSISGFRNGAWFACQAQTGEPGNQEFGNPGNPKRCCWVARWMNLSIVAGSCPDCKANVPGHRLLAQQLETWQWIGWKQWRNKEW